MKSYHSFSNRLLLPGVFALLVASTPASAVIEWIEIGDPGNPDDSTPIGFFGGVGDVYSISRFETTNAEYAAFLNAKAESDPLGLYDTRMETDTHGGILRSGSSGSYSYTTKAGFENESVNFITYFDALRFANWMHNGEGAGDTETGSYTLIGGTETPIDADDIVRNPGATVVLPNQDEWFKAAYYDGSGGIYYEYPTGTDEQPTCSAPTAIPNRGNCGNSNIRGVTPVGSYTGSPSPYGTFDQGGNVSEWNEDLASANRRIIRGGGWTSISATGFRSSGAGSLTQPTATNYLGFRLALLEGGPGGGGLDIAEIIIVRLLDRVAGVPTTDPYLFQACVSGLGIVSADLVPPGGSPIPLLDEDPDEFCLSSRYPNSAELYAAFPDGNYDFLITGESSSDSKSLDLAATEPGAYAEFLSPEDGDMVPADQNLVYEWMLVEKSNGVGCVLGMSCADELFLSIEEFDGFDWRTLVEGLAPITSTGTSVESSELQVGAVYESEVGTVNGAFSPGDMTDMGDPVETVTAWGDLNRIEVTAVPEPAASALGIVAVLTVVGVARVRGSRR